MIRSCDVAQVLEPEGGGPGDHLVVVLLGVESRGERDALGRLEAHLRVQLGWDLARGHGLT